MTDATPNHNPLEVLQVIDRLEVGPVRLEPRRLVAPYTASAADGSRHDAFEFIYRFEEDVFDPADAGAVNLASVMAAQIALNYGLFCRRIVFRGPLDRADRRFLEEMAANTAREIYVKKILQPNPFLADAARNLPIVRRESYLQAGLEFPDAVADARSVRDAERGVGNPSGDVAELSRVAVLSSGGKESLLSDALLREAGCETHAVFVNESGKHWFTALNAHRHFAAHVPHTGRVWTNSDRLFSWMLRHLPFIRQDFARLRADIYPVRLWTVAVFVFGALPLLLRRGIGRLVIGDEFDTSVRQTHEGIPHYDGLYDQSRYFDHALSRYFRRKGWGLSQFSILRPCSDLLVEKLLIERYPAVQRLQVSCHAAHTTQADETAGGEGPNETVVRPCGKCEKCTRVVGMLTALGGDATACGYSPAQIEHCLANLARQGASQETAVLQHVAYLLLQRGPLAEPGIAGVQARERPEVLKLRFDPERSPVDDVPVDLRRPVYRILLEHAAGAVRRSGRAWHDFDLLNDPALSRPYRFESPPRASAIQTNHQPDGESASTANERSYLLSVLTWPEAKRRFEETDVALLPVGAIEQHGHHLPLDTDTYDADLLCRQVGERCRDPKPLVLPPVPYGVSYHHDDFPGTISVGPETLARLVHEIGVSVSRHGVTKLVIVNGHGGNIPALHFAAQTINRDAHIFTCVDSGETSDRDVEALAETMGDVHAGEIETSTSLANRPHLVQMDKAKRSVPRFSSQYLDFSSQQSVSWYARTKKLSRSGVLGDPTKASREKGEKMWQLMIDHLVSLVEDLSVMTLDEIYQKTPV